MNKEIENIERLMNDKSVEFRDFRLKNIDVRQAADGKEEMVLEGVPCVFESETVLYKDKYYECREEYDKNVFAECDMSDVIFNYNHGGRVYARTRNKSLELEVKEDGLHMRATLMTGDEGHAQLYRDIKSGLIDRMSFAYHVKESEYRYMEQDDITVEIRKVTAIDKLYDVSAVDIPAYDVTSISARSAFDAEREKRKAESEKRAKDIEKIKLKMKLGGI